MINTAASAERIHKLIADSAKAWGFSFEDLNFGDANQLGLLINDAANDASRKKRPYGDKYRALYDLFYPDGKLDKDLYDAWVNWYGDFQYKMLEGINSVSLQTTDSAVENQRKNVEARIQQYIGWMSTFSDYQALGDSVKSSFGDYLSETIMNQITEEDLSGPAEVLESKIRALAESAKESFFRAYADIHPIYLMFEENLANTDFSDPEQVERINKMATEFSKIAAAAG